MRLKEIFFLVVALTVVKAMADTNKKNKALRMSVKAVDPNPTQLECAAKIQQLEQKITHISLEVAAVKSCACSSPGKGTSKDPYKIASIEDLQKLRGIWKNNTGKYFIVNQNIDLSSIATFAPLPGFGGILDGNNKKILNLKIDGTGLFRMINRTGQVKNLGLENVIVKGIYDVGGLAGHHYGRIDNSYVTGQVLGTSKYRAVGGLVGISSRGSRITDSYATANVSGQYYVGGLVGGLHGGTIQRCYGTGTVSGSDEVGGLVGDLYKGTIQNCYATGTVSGIGDKIGGLVGNNYGAILSSYATGDVSGRSTTGGLVGLSDLGGYQNLHVKISNSYATGDVSGSRVIGGLVGHNRGTITSCYAIGQVSGKRDRVGGLVGLDSGRVENSYGKQQYGTTNTLGAKPNTELKMPSTFTGWDTRLWKLTQNQYPKLKIFLN